MLFPVGKTMSANASGKLFESELKDIYDAEKRIEGALETMASDVDHEEARQAFEEHREQTRGQIERLEQVFEIIGMDPQTEECKAIAGMIGEHDRFTGENPDQTEHTLFDLIAAQKVEHYEIATYGSLAKLADQLGMSDAGDLLHENLEEEKQTLDRLTKLTDSYDFEQLPAAD